MKYLLLIFAIISIMFIGCGEDSTQTTTQPCERSNSSYRGSWLLTVTSDTTASDTVFVSTGGDAKCDSLRLKKQGAQVSLGWNFMGFICNNGSFEITSMNEFPIGGGIIPIGCCQKRSIAGGINGANISGSLMYCFYIQGGTCTPSSIGSITGSYNNNSASGSFTSPQYSGSWSITKIN